MSSGFVSENDLAEYRKKRQEEWEKVRSATDPIERPEETYDHRSLFERLQEQKQKKEMEYEEAHKLKNMIKGLDDDEIEFLDFVDRTKLAADKLKEKEEQKELSDFRQKVAILKEKHLDTRLSEESVINKKIEKPPTKTNLSQQQKLLKGAIIVKNAKRKHEETNGGDKVKTVKLDQEQIIKDNEKLTNDSSVDTSLKCIGILPGLGFYNKSSDEYSSDSDIEYGSSKFDLLGRKIQETLVPSSDKQK